MSRDNRVRTAELHEHILKSMYDGVHVIDMNGIVLIENSASEKMLGWTSCNLVGLHGHQTIHHHHADHSDFPAEECPIYQTIIDGKPRHVSDDVFWRQDGTCFPVEYATSPLRDKSGDVYGVTVVFRDISERKQAEKIRNAVFRISQAAHEADNLNNLLAVIHNIINEILPARNFYVALYDEKTNDLIFPYFTNEFCETPLPYSIEIAPLTKKVIKSMSVVNISQENSLDFKCEIKQIYKKGIINWLGVPLILENKGIGALVLQSYNLGSRYDKYEEEILQYVSTQVAIVINIQRQRDLLTRMATYDALTNVPNRFLFEDRLSQCLLHATRYRESFALLNIDLDKFKCVNDKYGHAAGDELLRAAVDRIRKCIRESDTISRVGGDEFLGLLPHIQGGQDVERVAESICLSLSHPFIIQEIKMIIGASIGIAIYPNDGADELTLKNAADQAMYSAKRGGGGRVQFYS